MYLFCEKFKEFLSSCIASCFSSVTVCVVLFRDFITLYVTVGIKFYSLWIITNVIASVFVYDVTVYSKSLASRHVGGTNRRCFEVIFVNWVKKYDYQNSIGLQSVLGVQNNFSTYFLAKKWHDFSKPSSLTRKLC